MILSAGAKGPPRRPAPTPAIVLHSPLGGSRSGQWTSRSGPRRLLQQQTHHARTCSRRNTAAAAEKLSKDSFFFFTHRMNLPTPPEALGVRLIDRI